MTVSAAVQRRFDEHAAYLAAHMPGLTLEVDEREAAAVIRGDIAVPAGGSIDRTFQIETRYAGLNPFRTPNTYDPVRRFPPNAERHIEPDSKFCLWLPQVAPKDFDTEDGLALYLHRVKQFLVLQLMYEHRVRRNITPRWPGDAWGHGMDGHEEWAREQIAQYPHCDMNLFIRDMAGGRGATSPDAKCPCRSGRTFRSCHRPLTETLRRHAAKDGAASAAIVRVLRNSA